MPVPVVNIGIMWVDVRQVLVPMRVRVRFTRRIVGRMNVLVMLVMRVPMVVHLHFMAMRMRVPLGQVQPNSGGHKQGGDQKSRAHCIAEKRDGHGGAHERRR